MAVAQANSNGDLDNPVTIAVYREIVDTLEWEKKEGKTMSPLEIIKTPTARKRFLIGMSPGPFSCIAGNIIASYYLGTELATAGITDSTAQLQAVCKLFHTTTYLEQRLMRPECCAERVVPCMLTRRHTPRVEMGS